MSDPGFERGKQRIDPATVNGWLDRARAGKPAPKRPPARGKFLAGPVPLPWLKEAARLPGKALAVGLAVWFLRGCRKRRTVRLTQHTLQRFGVNRKAGYRGLRNLERAGLVRVERHVGRCPVVTLCAGPPPAEKQRGGRRGRGLDQREDRER